MAEIEIKLAKSKRDRQAIGRFKSAILGKLGFAADEQSWIIYSHEDKEITGTLKTCSLDRSSPELLDYIKHCNPNKWFKVLKPSETTFSSQFIVANSRRKNRTVLSLIQKHYELLSKNKIRADFICSPEPTQPYYEWLGYRKFNKPFHHPNSAWPLVPMVLFVNDFEHLQRIHSPLIKGILNSTSRATKKQDAKKQDEVLKNFLEQNFTAEFTKPAAYIHLRYLANKYNLLFKNELMKPYIDALKHHKFAKGDKIFAKGDWGTSLYIITKGSIRTANRTVKTGEIIGISSLLSPGHRTYTAIANEESETLELDYSDFYSIIKDKPHTAPTILNLIGIELRELDTLLG